MLLSQDLEADRQRPPKDRLGLGIVPFAVELFRLIDLSVGRRDLGLIRGREAGQSGERLGLDARGHALPMVLALGPAADRQDFPRGGDRLGEPTVLLEVGDLLFQRLDPAGVVTLEGAAPGRLRSWSTVFPRRRLGRRRGRREHCDEIGRDDGTAPRGTVVEDSGIHNRVPSWETIRVTFAQSFGRTGKAMAWIASTPGSSSRYSQTARKGAGGPDPERSRSSPRGTAADAREPAVVVAPGTVGGDRLPSRPQAVAPDPFLVRRQRLPRRHHRECLEAGPVGQAEERRGAGRKVDLRRGSWRLVGGGRVTRLDIAVGFERDQVTICRCIESDRDPHVIIDQDGPRGQADRADRLRGVAAELIDLEREDPRVGRRAAARPRGSRPAVPSPVARSARRRAGTPRSGRPAMIRRRMRNRRRACSSSTAVRCRRSGSAASAL